MQDPPEINCEALRELAESFPAEVAMIRQMLAEIGESCANNEEGLFGGLERGA